MKAFLVRATPEITYEEDQEDNEHRIDALVDGKVIGHITFVTQPVDGDEDEPGFPFDAYKDAGKKILKTLYAHEEVVNLQHLEVNKDFRKQGVAKELMTRALEAIKKHYSGEPIYINASPMGNVMSLDTLVNFYTQYGFKVLKKYPEHRNALLWKESA